MSDYLHPVSRACQERSAETIQALSKSELVYVLADVYGVQPPTDDEGETIHPDDFNGSVSKEMMLELLAAADETTGFDSDGDESDGESDGESDTNADADEAEAEA